MRKIKTDSREIDIHGLCRAMSQSRLQLRYQRRERVHMVRQYMGSHSSEEGLHARVPLNLLSMYVQIVGNSLVAQHPRMMLSTFNRQAKPVVRSMQDWVNRQIKHINIKSTLRRCVIDSLFGIGICKVALANVPEAAKYAWNLKAGEPFAARVDLDDFVFDPHARAFEEADFIGHRMRVLLDTVRDNPHYNKSRKDLSPVDDEPYNVEGDEKISVLQRTYSYGITQDFEKYVDIWEVYLPKHRLIVTLPDDYLSGPIPSSSDGALGVQRWIGPQNGPYHILGHMVVPGNAMYKAPIQDLVDLHEAANQTLRKLMRSIERIKDLAAAPGLAMEDAARVMNANDGDVLQVNNPDLIKQFVVGGNAIQHLSTVFTMFKELFSYAAGNMDIAGGLSPQSKTAHQDEMLNQNASRLVSTMQAETTAFVQSVVEGMCWFYHNDPISVRHIPYDLQGVKGISTMRTVTPDMRKTVPWHMLQMEIDPYSLMPKTPEGRLASMNQVVTSIVIPMMQMLTQQGITFDMNAYLQKVAQYMDQPDLAEILTIREATAPTQGGDGGGDAPSPSETTRNYVRSNVSTQTNQSRARSLVASMPKQSGVSQDVQQPA
jgi:hypothetical protein